MLIIKERSSPLANSSHPSSCVPAVFPTISRASRFAMSHKSQNSRRPVSPLQDTFISSARPPHESMNRTLFHPTGQLIQGFPTRPFPFHDTSISTSPSTSFLCLRNPASSKSNSKRPFVTSPTHTGMFSCPSIPCQTNFFRLALGTAIARFNEWTRAVKVLRSGMRVCDMG
jgi:hypothetical protein